MGEPGRLGARVAEGDWGAGGCDTGQVAEKKLFTEDATLKSQFFSSVLGVGRVAAALARSLPGSLAENVCVGASEAHIDSTLLQCICDQDAVEFGAG
jgi:hypothetical protein